MSQAPDQFISPRIRFYSPDLFDQTGQTQMSFMTTDQRRFILEMSIRVAKLKDQGMRLGDIGREVPVADFDSSNARVSVKDLAKDVIGWQIGAHQSPRHFLSLLPRMRRN